MEGRRLFNKRHSKKKRCKIKYRFGKMSYNLTNIDHREFYCCKFCRFLWFVWRIVFFYTNDFFFFNNKCPKALQKRSFRRFQTRRNFTKPRTFWKKFEVSHGIFTINCTCKNVLYTIKFKTKNLPSHILF